MKKIVLLLMVLFLSSTTVGAQPEEDAPAERHPCRESVDVCVEKMRIEFKDRGTLGIGFRDPVPDDTFEGGVRWEVVGVIEGSAAEEAGLARGDVVVKWNGEVPGKPGFDERWVDSIRIGDEIEIEVSRDGERHSFQLTAREPNARLLEYWLLFYVQENFSKEELDAYRVKVEEKLGEGGYLK